MFEKEPADHSDGGRGVGWGIYGHHTASRSKRRQQMDPERHDVLAVPRRNFSADAQSYHYSSSRVFGGNCRRFARSQSVEKDRVQGYFVLHHDDPVRRHPRNHSGADHQAGGRGGKEISRHQTEED